MTQTPIPSGASPESGRRLAPLDHQQTEEQT